ncbi:MAG: hypothetical protein ACE5KZ_06495 [Candidatus Scalinduaceae bacterium]
MKLSKLKKYLRCNLAISEFKTSIKDEIKHYEKLAKKKGSSIPIDVVEDDELSIDKEDISKICDDYINEDLSVSEISYISDAMQLSEKIYIENNYLLDFIFEMSDPEVNGLFTKERALEIIKKICNKTF